MTLSNIEIVDTIVLDFAIVYFRNDGVVVFRANENVVNLNKEQLKTIFEAIIKLTNNKPSPLYVDLYNHIKLTDDEKNYLVNNLSFAITACALKEDNIMIRFVVHTFNYLYRPQTPIKMFKNEEDAVLWLKEF